MERIRKKYICKKQIKKGISGTKEILNFFKNGTSVALMIDQRVTEGLRSNFFNFPASTTTIPAQFVKKFGASVVPIHIERDEQSNFIMTINEPLIFSKNETTENITLSLNQFIEKMVKKNPEQWIWTHNRWK
jgi:KDO2-lipid IV(A) lauroyltransferase